MTAAATRPLTLGDRIRRYGRTGERRTADAKYAMPDGSYPISTCADVGDAAHLAHHSKTYGFDQVKRHVMKAKRALGCPDSVLPGTWRTDKSADLDDAELVGEGVRGSHVSRPVGEGELSDRRAARGDAHGRSQTTVIGKRSPMGGNALRPFDDGQASEDAAEGTDGPRFTKAQVDYSKGTAQSNCGNCRMFQGDSCALVQGPIAADMWCAKWAPETNRLDDQDSDDDVPDQRQDGTLDPDSRARSDGDSDDDDSLEEVRGRKPAGGADAGRPGPRDPNQKALPRSLTAREIERFYRLAGSAGDIGSNRQSWMPVFPEGVFQHPEYGDLVFDETTLPQYIANYRLAVRHIQPCVDIDHRNEEAAGWIADLEWRRGDGLYALIEWNELGASLLLDRRYKYASAQFGDYVDEATGETYANVLSAVTLTNFPFLKRMPAIQLAEGIERRRLWAGLHDVRARAQAGDLRLPPALAGRLDRWLVARRTPQTAGRLLAEARAIASELSGLGGPMADRDRTLTLPEFIKQGDDNVADDEEGMRKARRAKRAADDTDDQEAADSADGDQEAAEDSEDETASEDTWKHPSNAPFAKNSKQEDRSDGQASGEAPDLAGGNDQARQRGGMKGRATSERGMSPTERRLADENRQLRDQVGAIQRELREQAVAGQVRQLSEPHADSGIAFGPKVLDLYEQLALADREAGDRVLALLRTIREDGGLLLGGEWGDGGNGDEHDPYQASDGGSSPRRESRGGDPVVGGDVVKLAREYAVANKLDWSNPDQKLEAMDAVANGRYQGDNGRRRARGR